MQKIHFITTNSFKFELAEKYTLGTNIELIQEKVDFEIPEIQSFDQKEIAEWSAKWAAEKLQKPVAVTDTGWYINSLNGFPGPFIKFVNKYFVTEDFLKLLEGKQDRKVEIRETLAYCEPGNEPISFTGKAHGKIAETKGMPSQNPIEEIFIPNGFDMTIGEIDNAISMKFWGDNINLWQQLIKYFEKEN